MSSHDKVLGWFPHSSKEWIEFIIVAVLLWLLMVVAISELTGPTGLPAAASGAWLRRTNIWR